IACATPFLDRDSMRRSCRSGASNPDQAELSMIRLVTRAAALAAVAVLTSSTGALAHCFVGGRFFPATLAIDDPCVADELSVPTVSAFRTGDDPPARQLDVSFEYSKRITETFGISIGSTWTHLRTPGMPSASGWQNLETTFKYQFLTLPEHEFVMSAALSVEWGNTGAV